MVQLACLISQRHVHVYVPIINFFTKRFYNFSTTVSISITWHEQHFAEIENANLLILNVDEKEIHLRNSMTDYKIP